MLTLNVLTNKIIREIKNDFLDFMKENYDIEITAPFKSQINHFFGRNQLKSFKEDLLNVYDFKVRIEKDCKLYRLYAGIYKQDIEDYFYKHDINKDFYYNEVLFKIYYKNPENQILQHVKTVIQKGHIEYASEDEINSYCAIVYSQTDILALNTTVIIKGNHFHGSYEVISVFPSCHPGPYFYLTDLKKTSENSNKLESNLKCCNKSFFGERFSFYNPYSIIDSERMKNEIKEQKYCIYGFVLEAEIVEQKAHYINLIENDFGIPFYEMTVPFDDAVQFLYMGKRFYQFNYDGKDDFDLYGRGKVPFFMRIDLLPKETKIFKEDYLNIKVIFCGHLANKDADLDYFKFGFGLALFQPKIPSKEEEARYIQKKQTNLTNQYCSGVIIDYTRFDECILKSCQLFHQKYGVYPNYIKTNTMTVEKIFNESAPYWIEKENLQKNENLLQNYISIGGDDQNRLCFETAELKLYFVDDKYLSDDYFILMLGDSPDGDEPVNESEYTETLCLRKVA